MFRRPIDIISIGDITTDAFIRLKDAHVHCKLNHSECELCMKFGSKIPFEYVKVIRAVGNAANASVAAARLGLRSALVSDLGNDQNGKECLQELQENKVITSYVNVHKGKPTNYHFVLWFDSDRTILVNHIDYDYRLPVFPEPRWIYLTSLAAQAFHYHEDIARYLEAHPKVKLSFQPGTYQIKQGLESLKEIYRRTDVLTLNLEEAARILNLEEKEAKKKPIKTLLKKIHSYGPKLVLITDSTEGAYMFDGDHYYHMPIYPDPRPALERTGCGDAFASTFVSMLASGKTPLEALLAAPANAMSVAQYVGSQKGLLTQKELDWWLMRAPSEYRPREL